MTHLPTTVLLPLADAVERHLGLELHDNRLPDLQRMLDRLHAELGFSDAAACAHWLTHHPWTEQQLTKVAAELTISETYFYRDTVLMRLLEDELLPQLVAQKAKSNQQLRLWSVGCSTGEEPYMLAMLLDRVLADWGNWQVHLLASDINRDSLAKARAGRYREWAFRQAPPWLKADYFETLPNGDYVLDEQIRRRVSFTALNLSQPGYPSVLTDTHQMDLVICRNVLMYFSAAKRAAIVERLRQALVSDGWLLGSPSEAGTGCFRDFQVVSKHGRSLYRKADPVPSPRPPSTPAASARVPVPRRRMPVARRQARPTPRAATKPAPEIPEARVLLDQARASAERGQFDQALSRIRQSIELDKLNARAYYLQATVLEEQGEMPAVRKALQQALYLDPEFIMAHLSLAGVLQRQGESRAAQRHLANADRLLRHLDDQAVIPESEGMGVPALRQHLSAMGVGDIDG